MHPLPSYRYLTFDLPNIPAATRSMKARLPRQPLPTPTHLAMCGGTCDHFPESPPLHGQKCIGADSSSTADTAPARNYCRSKPSAAILTARGALPSLVAPPRKLHRFSQGLECHPDGDKALRRIPRTASSRRGGTHRLSCISPVRFPEAAPLPQDQSG
jgi:hypothetical protein